MSRRYVTLYLGDLENKALAHCPAGTKRGQWINHLAGQMVTWRPEQWTTFVRSLAPRPRPRLGKLSVALPAQLAADLDKLRGHVSLADALRTALLRAAGVPYTPIPSLEAPEPASRIDPAVPTVPVDPEPGARESSLELAIDTQVNFDEAPDVSTEYRTKEADADQVRDVRILFGRREHLDQACYPDLTPQAQREIATGLLAASPGNTVEFWLGISQRRDQRLAFTGLVDSRATLGVLEELLDACGRTMLVTLTRYDLGPDPDQVLLTVNVLLKSPTPPHLGGVEILTSTAADAVEPVAPSPARPDLDPDLPARNSERIATLLSRLSAIEGDLAERRGNADHDAAEVQAAVEAVRADVTELDQRTRDLEQAFEELIPMLDGFKRKWRS